MPDNPESIQTGAALSRAIVAAFRAQGTSLGAWCAQNDVSRENVRQAAYGVWSGPKGKETLARVIDAAGCDTVAFLHAQNLKTDAAHVPSGSSRPRKNAGGRSTKMAEGDTPLNNTKSREGAQA